MTAAAYVERLLTPYNRDMYYWSREESADQAIERNKEMFVRGWISRDELEQRTGWILGHERRAGGGRD